MNRTALTVVCLATASVAISNAVAATPAITQTSIAGASLGKTAATYRALFRGHFTTVADAGNGLALLSFPKNKVNVYFDGSGKAVIITTWNKAYKTDHGIGPCSTIARLKNAYGSAVHPDHFGTVGTTYFSYDVGKNLIFAAPGPAGNPSTSVTAVGLFNGTAPHANANGGARPVAGYTSGYKTPRCR